MAAAPVFALLRRALLLALLAPLLGACAVIAVTSTVVGAGVTVASTAVDATVAVGKGVVNVGGAVLGSGK
ncbi:MAG TPA: hypothetical protein DCW29_14270 [Janthinobacterium sp.]|nr:hypothetical protein [Janthinobacterium sp.]